MGSHKLIRTSIAAAALAVVCNGIAVSADQVPIRRTEGLVHGFLALRTLDGTTIADGDLEQAASGDRVTSRLRFTFRDGSLHDETAEYSQRGQFRLVGYHLIQKGPTFPRPLDMTINRNGDVTVRYADDGESKIEKKRLELPPNVANGILLVLMKNVRPNAVPATWSYVAATPKPELVKLNITSAGQEAFTTGGTRRSATHYVVKVDIGGIKGVLASLLGKEPPDSHVWILGGDFPAFVRSEQSMYLGGPMWRIELVSPRWPGLTGE